MINKQYLSNFVLYSSYKGNLIFVLIPSEWYSDFYCIAVQVSAYM